MTKDEKLLEKGKNWKDFENSWMNKEQLCLATQIGLTKMNELIKDGKIRSYNVGDKVFYVLSEVLEDLKKINS